jgi:hypothetical protein
MPGIVSLYSRTRAAPWSNAQEFSVPGKFPATTPDVHLMAEKNVLRETDGTIFRLKGHPLTDYKNYKRTDANAPIDPEPPPQARTSTPGDGPHGHA